MTKTKSAWELAEEAGFTRGQWAGAEAMRQRVVDALHRRVPRAIVDLVRDIPADPPEPECACEGHGWLHMEDSMGRGPGIERCDSCALFDSDEAACVAHDSVCDCGLKVVTEEP